MSSINLLQLTVDMTKAAEDAAARIQELEQKCDEAIADRSSMETALNSAHARILAIGDEMHRTRMECNDEIRRNERLRFGFVQLLNHFQIGMSICTELMADGAKPVDIPQTKDDPVEIHTGMPLSEMLAKANEMLSGEGLYTAPPKDTDQLIEEVEQAQQRIEEQAQQAGVPNEMEPTRPFVVDNEALALPNGISVSATRIFPPQEGWSATDYHRFYGMARRDNIIGQKDMNALMQTKPSLERRLLTKRFREAYGIPRLTNGLKDTSNHHIGHEN